MVPSSAPASSIKTMSSSLTVSSFSLGSIPKSLRVPLVATVSNQIIGLKSAAKKLITPQNVSASFSLWRIATRLGTSSPKTKVKNERINVITTTETELIAPAFSFEMLNVLIRYTESFSPKLSAAKAEAKNPANVIPI